MPKAAIRITINFRHDEWPRGKTFLSAIGRRDLADAPQNQFGYTLKLKSEDELAQLKALAAMFGFDNHLGPVSRELLYSSQELASAALLSVFYTRPGGGLGGPGSGTQYDYETGCQCCGTGARQISELFIKGKLPNKTPFIETLTGEWLVAQQLSNKLTEFLTGVELRPVRDKRSREILPWVQLLPEVTLPRFSSATRGISVNGQCACCSRDGHFDAAIEPFEPHYGQKVCELPNDAVMTWEHFGLSRLRSPRSDSALAAARLLISSRLYQVLEAHGVRGLEFIPVTCDGST